MLLELMFLVFLGSFILIFSFVNVTSSVWLVIILLSNIFEYFTDCVNVTEEKMFKKIWHIY